MCPHTFVANPTELPPTALPPYYVVHWFKLGENAVAIYSIDFLSDINLAC